MLIRFGLLLVLSFVPALATAHDPSDSFITINARETDKPVTIRWDIALTDLDFLMDLDANKDQGITWGELIQRDDDVADLALQNLAINSGSGGCGIEFTEPLMIDSHSGGTYAVLQGEVACQQNPLKQLTVEYSLLFDIDEEHRSVATVYSTTGVQSVILTRTAPTRKLDLVKISTVDRLLEFTWEGIWHIWIGFDHILFLVVLLLPIVLIPSFKSAGIELLKIVTSFTIAHSITLSLATLELVTLPSRMVESVIAASILVAALNNIVKLIPGREWVIAFGFGLVHGFGFASVLGDLGLPAGALLWSLLGFNVGVEIGQLAIVAVAFPLLFAGRKFARAQAGILYGGSIACALIAVAWMIERICGLEFMPV